ncbi:uncharacterized protein A4U43_C02F12740 [Asparagus officinalis]|uniref:Uncharacterized protein n=1 Tax=Asparagus officinalis TaxID=4686 RepID=A0A5P1FMQ0_ASPOF|nr:uncharacterized protein A4U43_C02F12740 [Asparagus officinalis]
MELGNRRNRWRLGAGATSPELIAVSFKGITIDISRDSWDTLRAAFPNLEEASSLPSHADRANQFLLLIFVDVNFRWHGPPRRYDLFTNLVDMVPLVESLMDRRANLSFRRASIVQTTTPKAVLEWFTASAFGLVTIFILFLRNVPALQSNLLYEGSVVFGFKAGRMLHSFCKQVW